MSLPRRPYDATAHLRAIDRGSPTLHLLRYITSSRYVRRMRMIDIDTKVQNFLEFSGPVSKDTVLTFIKVLRTFAPQRRSADAIGTRTMTTMSRRPWMHTLQTTIPADMR